MENVTDVIANNSTATTSSDDSSDILAMAKKMHWTASVVIGTIFVIIGLTGNTISMYIWRRRSMRSSTGTYLIALAVMDSGLLILFLLIDIIGMMNPEIKKNYVYAVFFCYIGFPTLFFFVITSIWILVGVTVDRYIQVCWIAHSKVMCNDKRAWTGIGIISLLCFLINLPHFNSFYPIADDVRMPGKDAFDKTEFGAGVGGMRYEFYVHCIFLVLAPWFTILILNMQIICRIGQVNRQMNKTRGDSGKSMAKKSENQITRVLLTVTFTFLVLVAFQCITQCFFMLKPANSNHRIVDEAFAVAKLGVVINSSINFFLYCLSGQRFRNELLFLIKSKCPCFPTTSYELSTKLVESSSGTNTSTTGASRL